MEERDEFLSEEYYNWNIPPTQKEINSLISLLKDFTISVDVPDFKTRREMDRWRRTMIDRAFASMN